MTFEKFLSYFETEYVYNLIVNLDQQTLIMAGAAIAVIVVFLILIKMVRMAALIVTLLLMALLLHFFLPGPDESMDLVTLMVLFVGGIAIVGGGIYYIFIRAD